MGTEDMRAAPRPAAQSKKPLSPGERLVAVACRRRFIGGSRVGIRRPRTPKPATPTTVHPSADVAAETMTPLSCAAVVTPDRSAKNTAPPSPSTQASSSSFSYDRELLCDVRRAVLCGRERAPSPPPVSNNDHHPHPAPKINNPPSPSPSFVVEGDDDPGDCAAVSDGVCAWTRSSLDVLAYVVAPCKDIFDTKYCGPVGRPPCDGWCYNAEEEEGSAGGSMVDYAKDGEDEALEHPLSERVDSSSSYGGSLAPLVDYPGGGIDTGRLGIAPIHHTNDAYNLLDAPSVDEDGTGHTRKGKWATSLSRMMRQSNLLAPEGERTFVPFDTFQFLSVDMNISLDDPDGSNVADADGIEPTMEMASPQQLNVGAQSSVEAASPDEEETKGHAALSANGNATTPIGKNPQALHWKRERIKSLRFRRRDRLPHSAIDPVPVESTIPQPPRGNENEPPAPESPAALPCSASPRANADDDADGRHRRRTKMAKVKRRRDMLRAAAAS